MDAVALLKELGFARVIRLQGAECGVECKTILLAIWTYEAEKVVPDEAGWIHPYYPASQKAYRMAQQAVQSLQEAGLPASLRNDIRLKPIFARLPGFSQGRNTLSYIEGLGSRFHVQVIGLELPMGADLHLLPDAKPLHCGDCRACMDACPTHAIDGEGFHRERCLRQWMLPGKVVPEELRAAMGHRFLGCDECQRVCPHNPPAMGEVHTVAPMEKLLQSPKEHAALLGDLIGVNLAMPNRVLSQACMVAGCGKRAEDLPLLAAHQEHPSPVVREHARWAMEHLQKNLQEP